MENERSCVCAPIVGLLVAAAPGAATLAQESTEEVVITGSRIARASDFESPSPVITVDHDAIEKVQSQHGPRGRFWSVKAMFSF